MSTLTGAFEVAHLIPGDSWAGAEVATYHLLVALSATPGLRLRAVILNEGELAQRLRASQIPTEVIDENKYGFPALVARVRRTLARVDAIHSHRDKTHLLAALSGRPWLATQHGRPEPMKGKSAALRASLYLAIDSFTMRRARRVLAVSEEVASWLAARGASTRILRCWNGVADPALASGPFPYADRPMRVGCLGRLYPVKCFQLAIEAVALCPHIELEIVGDGPEGPLLDRLIRELGVADRVRLLGHMSNPLPVVARWRALLVTSHHEGNPIGVLEAMGLGTPIIAADIAGVREILGGRGGVVLQGREPAEWARELQRHLPNDRWGAELSSEARDRFLTTFTSAAAAARVASVYASIEGEIRERRNR